jgi:rhodanese-related sulfurtransferase
MLFQGADKMKNHGISPYYLIAVVALILLVISSCAARNRNSADISPADAQKMIAGKAQDSAFVLLDVRTPEEFSSGHLAGAVNIDFRASDFQTKVDSLPKSRTYLLYCRTGHRSANALTLMKGRGFQNVFNMVGGITRWREENREIRAN